MGICGCVENRDEPDKALLVRILHKSEHITYNIYCEHTGLQNM